jgi:hypothetical protein
MAARASSAAANGDQNMIHALNMFPSVTKPVDAERLMQEGAHKAHPLFAHDIAQSKAPATAVTGAPRLLLTPSHRQAATAGTQIAKPTTAKPNPNSIINGPRLKLQLQTSSDDSAEDSARLPKAPSKSPLKSPAKGRSVTSVATVPAGTRILESGIKVC